MTVRDMHESFIYFCGQFRGLSITNLRRPLNIFLKWFLIECRDKAFKDRKWAIRRTKNKNSMGVISILLFYILKKTNYRVVKEVRPVKTSMWGTCSILRNRLKERKAKYNISYAIQLGSNCTGCIYEKRIFLVHLAKQLDIFLGPKTES